MKNPFQRKKPGDTLPAPEQEGELTAKNKKFRLKLSVKNLFKKRESGVGEPVEAPQPPAAAPEASAEEPAKAKKQKKQKPVKIDRGDKKKPPVLLFVILGVVAVGGGIAAALLLFGGETVEERLEKAAQYTLEAKFEEAIEVYDELLLEDITLVNAYLGQADTYLAQEDLDAAMGVLGQGLTATGSDPVIAAKLEAITPQPEEEEAEAEEDAPPAPTNEPIVWQDAALEKMVRTAMGIPESQTITEGDLREVRYLKIIGPTHATTDNTDVLTKARNSMQGYTIAGTLYEERGDIRSLADLRHFPALRKLVVCYNQVTDISGVANLAELETLGLYCNDIADISALSGLESLKYLYLYGNRISSIEPLAGLTSLQSAYLQYNEIVDLWPVKGLGTLSDLHVGNNKVMSIEAIAGLDNLRFFYADNNDIIDIRPVANAKGLTDVSFIGNPVSDYAPAGGISNVNKSY